MCCHIILPALAQYYQPAPPKPIVLKETNILISYTKPQKTIALNITQFDPEQIVRELNITFKEAVLTINFTIYYLKDKPPGVSDPPNMPLLYFTIRIDRVLLENIENVSIIFSIEKSIVEDKKIDEKTIILWRFVEDNWDELKTKEIVENEHFLYFEASSTGLSHFAATGIIVPPFPWWIITIAIAVIAAAISASLYIRKKKRGGKKA